MKRFYFDILLNFFEFVKQGELDDYFGESRLKVSQEVEPEGEIRNAIQIADEGSCTMQSRIGIHRRTTVKINRILLDLETITKQSTGLSSRLVEVHSEI
jgi:hypothetical protein